MKRISLGFQMPKGQSRRRTLPEALREISSRLAVPAVVLTTLSFTACGNALPDLDKSNEELANAERMHGKMTAATLRAIENAGREQLTSVAISGGAVKRMLHALENVRLTEPHTGICVNLDFAAGEEMP